MQWISPAIFTDGTAIPVDSPHFGRAVRCACGRAADEQRLAEFLWRQAHLPPAPGDREAWRFSDYRRTSPEHETAYNAVVQWATGPTPNRWLFLYGTPGTGKTHLSCAAVAALIGGKVVARYEYVPDLIDYLRQHQIDGAGEDRIDQLRATEVLVLDDLGAVKLTEYAEGEILKLVDHRYREQASLMVTTNTSLEEIEARTLDRLTDRYLSRAVPMVWPSYRQQRPS